MSVKYKLDGSSLLHIPNEVTRNKFLLLGKLAIDGVMQPGKEDLVFRLVDQSRVAPVVASLSRVTSASAEWSAGETAGVLRLKYAPPLNTGEAQADAQHGGPERTIRVQDLVRDVAKSKGITQSRNQQEPNGERDYRPPEPSRCGPTMER